jgi:peptidoglycan/LPS O-acetylase OafA/YrhL
MNHSYRLDIDGLRAIAVFSVIFFHLGHLPAGYLGVDVFFVISGFLITGIIYPKILEERFSLSDFYLRRIRRILPLAGFICTVALAIGVATMLPDDLENLAQSVIATNFFSNNVLEFLKRLDYWGIVSEYKPLMHTWSLGVEEQFYFVYPFLLLLLHNRRWSVILPALYVLSAASLGLFLLPGIEPMTKFYLPVFRFWELALGGIAAIHLHGRQLTSRGSTLSIFALLVLLISGQKIPNTLAQPLAVILTVWILATAAQAVTVTRLVLCNPVCSYLGKISYSLYMWHQLVFAFGRYFWRQELSPWDQIVLIALVILLSIATYHLIEQPFRNPKKIRTPWIFAFLAGMFVVSTLWSIHIVRLSGVIRDVPELEAYRSTAVYGQHSKYNGAIYLYDKSFETTDKIKVLVTGDSFGRDFANILLESRFASAIEISYVCWVEKHPEVRQRFTSADIIFSSRPEISQMNDLDLPLEKVWAIGSKNFGTNTGFFFNQRGENYFLQRAKPQKEAIELNKRLKAEWGARFIDLMEPVIAPDGTVPVFTPDRRFISQDTHHFTKAGAKFYADVLEEKLGELITIQSSQR